MSNVQKLLPTVGAIVEVSPTHQYNFIGTVTAMPEDGNSVTVLGHYIRDKEFAKLHEETFSVRDVYRVNGAYVFERMLDTAFSEHPSYNIVCEVARQQQCEGRPQEQILWEALQHMAQQAAEERKARTRNFVDSMYADARNLIGMGEHYRLSTALRGISEVLGSVVDNVPLNATEKRHIKVQCNLLSLGHYQLATMFKRKIAEEWFPDLKNPDSHISKAVAEIEQLEQERQHANS